MLVERRRAFNRARGRCSRAVAAWPSSPRKLGGAARSPAPRKGAAGVGANRRRGAFPRRSLGGGSLNLTQTL